MRFTWNECSPRIATLDCKLSAIEPKFRLDRFRIRTVAFITVFDEDRPYTILKEIQLL